MLLLPVASTAEAPLALVFMPQPRFTVGLPENDSPVPALFLSEMTQYLPVWTTAAVADAVMVGAVERNMPENAMALDPDTVTATALYPAPFHGLAGVPTVQDTVVSSR